MVDGVDDHHRGLFAFPVDYKFWGADGEGDFRHANVNSKWYSSLI